MEFSRRDLFEKLTLTPRNCDALRTLLKERPGLGQSIDAITVLVKDWRVSDRDDKQKIWLRKCLRDVWSVLSSDALESRHTLTLRIDGPDVSFGGDLSQFESYGPDELNNWQQRIEYDEDAIRVMKATTILCGWEGPEEVAEDELLPEAPCVTKLYFNQAVLKLDTVTYFITLSPLVRS